MTARRAGLPLRLAARLGPSSDRRGRRATSVHRYVADLKVDGSGMTFRATLEEPRFMPMFRAPEVERR
jgi:hypothetical protein